MFFFTFLVVKIEKLCLFKLLCKKTVSYVT